MGGRLIWASDTAPIKAPAGSVLTPELTEGPYYIDLERIRRDITEGKPGVPLKMRIKVVHVTTAAPIPGAAVDVWHCDAQGVYSGFSSHMPPPGQGPPPMGDDDDMGMPPGPPPGDHGPGQMHKPDNNQTFLRGVQITNESGIAEIDTIFPGWYQGRTTHIHVRVHLGGTVADGRYQGGHTSHTGQIFFPEDITDQVYQLPAYAKQGTRIPLKEDGIFDQGGSLPQLTQIHAQQLSDGFSSDTLLVIDPDATPRPA